MTETAREWKPIDTAPADTNVEVGGWEIYNGSRMWAVSSGMVFETRLFGLWKQRQYVGRVFSHWRPLPPPPINEAHDEPATA